MTAECRVPLCRPLTAGLLGKAPDHRQLASARPLTASGSRGWLCPHSRFHGTAVEGGWLSGPGPFPDPPLKSPAWGEAEAPCVPSDGRRWGEAGAGATGPSTALRPGRFAWPEASITPVVKEPAERRLLAGTRWPGGRPSLRPRDSLAACHAGRLRRLRKGCWPGGGPNALRPVRGAAPGRRGYQGP